MRIVNLENLKGGEIAAKVIYDENGRILLSEGLEITEFHIKKLSEMGVRVVYVDDEISKDVEVEESISEETRVMSKNAIKDMLDKYGTVGSTTTDGIIKAVNTVVDEILDNKHVLLNVSQIKASDNSLHSHSVNVCVLSVFMGLHAGYNSARLKDLAIGAMLHDVGKMKILQDKEMINKKNEQQLKKYIDEMHSKVGYEFLRAQNKFSAHTNVAVLMHHENIDGSGHPLGLKETEINENAKIISICDTFDNLLRGKEQERIMPVYEILEYLVAMSGYRFDIELVRKFSSTIAVYPSGTGVILNTNEKGIVVRQNKSTPLRPVVKVVYNNKGEKLIIPKELDLNKELTVFIIATCDL